MPQEVFSRLLTPWWASGSRERPGRAVVQAGCLQECALDASAEPVPGRASALAALRALWEKGCAGGSWQRAAPRRGWGFVPPWGSVLRRVPTSALSSQVPSKACSRWGLGGLLGFERSRGGGCPEPPAALALCPHLGEPALCAGR